MATYPHAPREEAIPGTLDAARVEIAAHTSEAFCTPPVVTARIAGILLVLGALSAGVMQNQDTHENPTPPTVDSQR